MEKQSWPTLSGPKGFSLIELLVVVAIIGFLSAIGMAVYADVQARSRDAKRKADIDSIAKVLEIHKTDEADYQSLDLTWFGSSEGLPTTDPKGKPYCLSTSATSDPLSTWVACSDISASWVPVDAGVPAAGATSWRVCTFLENPAPTGEVYCRYSVQ